MMTLRQLAAEPLTLPTRTTWYLTDLAEARGKQELFTRESPQKLKVLREHALIESAICLGVSRDMIRHLLRDLKSAGHIECLGRGPGAKWRKRVLPLKEGNKEGNNEGAKG
jgi:predicted transcriptional regulator of viral defense system